MLNKNWLGTILQCHIDSRDPESFVVGQLEMFDDKWFLMQDISPVGLWNGIALYLRSDIVSVDEHSIYIDKLTSIIEYRGLKKPSPPPLFGELLTSLLTFAKRADRLIGIELYKSGWRNIVGSVAHLDNDLVCVRQIDEFGQSNGISYVLINAITRVFVADADLEALEILINKTADHSHEA